ncbi:hypothetical protein [Lacipirellula parvula]|uniref:Uncharacterized protein n=1 Tax=Lacipirellula parvula TaxID=2650471 RepID=A0A5K7XHM7_9BACT|nr:hypothetical protein [Lacipirellula parvula]BBO34461.1 hypothetical protein PLANPX_4073 [Lacipirellula parvula]
MKTAQQILDSIDTLFGNVATDRQGTVEAMKLIARRANAYASLETEDWSDDLESLSDNQLVAEWRSGTAAAETELSNRHRAALVKSIATRTGDAEAAELIADAAFASARERFNPVTENFFCHLLAASVAA